MSVEEFNRLLRQVKFDKVALTKIYNYFFPRIVMHIAYRYQNVDPKDVAQEFFLYMLDFKPSKFIINPSAWVLTACDHFAEKEIKRSFNEVSLDEDDVEKLPSPIDVVNDYLDDEKIQEIFESLDEDSQKIFYMYYWEGLTMREISKKLNINLSNVKQKHVRNVKKIKKLLLV